MFHSNITNARTALNPPAWLVVVALFFAFTGVVHAAATAAGRAVFANGAPQAVDQAGAVRTLKRGDDVFSGDRLETPNGSRLQVSFVDGAYISLQPDSEYEIAQYQYSGQQDGTERATYRLLKGGVRAVTGLIGKKNPDAYKVQTPVATIGIRGTGHNTRYCHGDCPGRRDGLYHNTWEGITFVVNDVGSVEVPTGSGVFVEGLDKPIEFLDQPPGVTAVDTGDTQENEQEKEEDRGSAFLVGDQRTGEGDQTIVPRGSSTVTSGLGLAGIGPDQDHTGVDKFVHGRDASIFVRDSDQQIVGLLLLKDEESGSQGPAATVSSTGITKVTVATTDLDSVTGGDNPDAVSAAGSLLALADPQLVTSLQEKPAEVADQFFDDGLGFFRWTNGRILVVSDSGDAPHIVELNGFQSFHFIFGPEPPPLPVTGFASYEFIGGTQSTSLSGATIGKGATEGQISVDFGSSSGSLFMKVDHADIVYQVFGSLGVKTGGDFGIIGQSIYASVMSPTGGAPSGGECYPSCPANIDGGFAGPATTDGFPEHIGLAYEIDVSDPITGVAGFKFTGHGQPPAGN